MTDARQIQLQLFGRPSWLAGRRTFEASGSGHVLAGTIAPTSLTCAVDVPQPRSISSNFLKDQSSERQLLSVGHHVCSPRVEDHSTRIGFDDVQNLFAGSANEDR